MLVFRKTIYLIFYFVLIWASQKGFRWLVDENPATTILIGSALISLVLLGIVGYNVYLQIKR